MKFVSVSAQAKVEPGGLHMTSSLLAIFARWVQVAYPESTTFSFLHEVNNGQEKGIVCQYKDVQYFVTLDTELSQYMISISRPVMAMVPCDADGAVSQWQDQSGDPYP